MTLTPDDADDAEPPGEWSSLRDLIGAARSSGFDEEPSPRIDALLMAAARQYAPAPRRSWWTRLVAWMKPVMLHPAMAGAAALVVVAGAAGVMYRRGDGEVARPAPPPERAALAKDDRGADEFQAAEAPAPAPTEPVAPVTLAPVGPTAPDSRAGAKPADRKPTPRSASGKSSEPWRAPAGGGGPGGEDLGGLAIQMSPTVNEERDDVSFDDAVVNPAPAPPPSAPSSGTPRTGTMTADETDAVRSPESVGRDAPERAALLRDARAAARRGDCTSVAAMSTRVRALDPGYHRDVFARDPDIVACLTRKP